MFLHNQSIWSLEIFWNFLGFSLQSGKYLHSSGGCSEECVFLSLGQRIIYILFFLFF